SVAGVMRFVYHITAPLTGLLSASTDLGMRILGIKPSGEPPITEEEIRVLIDQGTEVGVFDEAEQDMVEGVFRLNERSINAIMTPRTEIEWLDADDKIEEILWTLSEKSAIKFHNLFDRAATRAEIVATFLALLELIRLKQVRAQQSAHFGEIEIVKPAV
ncbi:MAG: segregation/condensation protein A, partial [Anaerolineales bacterium]|nr:segregation/condensation protein A [Anaerolineales bacterium]